MTALLPPDARRIAVICPSWVGDAIMATPAYRALRRHRPEARITAFVRGGLDQVLRGLPSLDDIVVTPMKGALGPWRTARAIRRSKADAAVMLPNSFRSALAARLSGAPTRIGYDRDGRRKLLTHAVPVVASTTPTSAVPYYLHLVNAAIGGDTDADADDVRIELVVTPEERDAAATMLTDVGAQRLVVLNPGANRADKRWPATRFAELADRLTAELDVAIAVTGGPSEASLVAELCAAAKTPLINLVSRGITLGSLKAVLSRASLLVTNDTGPRHIAAALGIPAVAIFGPTDHRWTTLPNVAERRLLAEPFLPDTHVADDHAGLCAIERIPISDVLHASGEMLGRSDGVTK